MRVAIVIALVVAGSLGGFVLGRSTARPGGAASTGPVIVSFRGGSIRAGDVAARLGAEPEAMRAQLRTPEARRALVEALARIELLAAKAEAQGLDRDPALVRRHREELGALYLAKAFDEPERALAPTGDEVRKFFDEHRAERSHPERARVALVAFLSEDPATRPQKRALAEAALAEARRRASDYYAFGTIARLRSEEPRSRASNGELPPLGKDELAAHFGQEVADAAFAMERPELLRRVIESPKGFFVVKLLSKDPAYEPRLEDVRDQIRAKLANDRREADLRAFFDRLWREADVRIDEDALKTLQL